MTLFTIETAQQEERAAALWLAFQHLGEEEGGNRVANALKLVSSGELDPAGILVIRDGGQLEGAFVISPLAGAGGLIWPPHVREGPQRSAKEDQLVQTGLAWLRSRGAKVVQAVLHDEELPLAKSLVRNGFIHVTRLRYLRHDLPEPVSVLTNLAVQPYSSADRGLFHEVLLRTYQGTLDCPELNGLRTIEEIIEGHQAQGEFKPDRWWLAFEDKKPVGVLLTSANPEVQGWDISYVGVVPEARGRGWGGRLIQLAITEARTAGAAHLTVGVDARNHPAWNLYTALGFAPTGDREVFLKFLQQARA